MIWTTSALGAATLGLAVWLCPPGLTLAEALERARKGEPLEGKVELATGRSAAAAIEARTPRDALPALVAVARAGGAGGDLARALSRAARPDAPSAAALLAALLELPAEARAEADAFALERALLEPEGEGADALRDLAARALVTSFPPDRLLWRLGEWTEDPAALPGVRALLEHWPSTPRPVEAWSVLAEAEVPVALRAEAARSLERLVEGDDAVTERALAAVEEGRWGTLAIGLSSLTGVAEARHERTREVLAQALEVALGAGGSDPAQAEPVTLAAFVEVAAEHLLPELYPRLPELSAPGAPVPVRVAAVLALGRMGARDRPTVERLIALLEDRVPEVREAAYKALRTQTGRRNVPADPQAWRVWLQSANTPALRVEPDEERLERERGILRRRRRAPAS